MFGLSWTRWDSLGFPHTQLARSGNLSQIKLTHTDRAHCHVLIFLNHMFGAGMVCIWHACQILHWASLYLAGDVWIWIWTFASLSLSIYIYIYIYAYTYSLAFAFAYAYGHPHLDSLRLTWTHLVHLHSLSLTRIGSVSTGPSSWRGLSMKSHRWKTPKTP